MQMRLYFFLALSFLYIQISNVFALDFSTFNIRFFDPQTKSKATNLTDLTELTKILTKVEPDFLTVEEIKNHVAFKEYIDDEFPSYGVVLATCGGTGKQKVGFVYKKDEFELVRYWEDFSFSKMKNDFGGCGSLRSVLLGQFIAKKSRQNFIAIGVHLKAGGSADSMERRWEQYKMLTKLISQLKASKNRNIIVMGDFNTTGYLTRNQDMSEFQEFISKSNLEELSDDIGCSAYYSQGNEDMLPGKLDHVLATSNFLNLSLKNSQVFSHCNKVRCNQSTTLQLGITYSKVSDHCPVEVTLN